MRFLKPTIASRLMLIILGCGLVFVVAGTLIQFYLAYSREMRILEEQIHDVERSHVQAMENSIWLADWDMVRVQAEGIQRLPEIRFVGVTADDGRRIVAIGNELTDEAHRHEFPLRRSYKGQNLFLGTLTVHADVDAVRQRLYSGLLIELVAQVIIVFLTCTILFYLFHRLAGRHLTVMSGYLRSFSPERLETPLTLDKVTPGRERFDELDQVVFSFNEMRQNLKRSFDALRRINEELREENHERLRAEKALRESEQRYSLLVNNIQEVFWMVTPDYQRVLFISPAYEKIWGRSCDSLIARPDSWLDAVIDDDRQALAAVIAAIGKGSDLPTQIDFPEYRIMRPDGEVRWIKANGVPIRNEQGEIWAIAGLCEDISSRRVAEEKLCQAQKMEAIGTLAGGIAHDFNNILAAILGHADLLRYDMDADDPYRGNVDEIIRAGKRAKELIRQILAFSRKSSEKPRSILVAPIAKEVLKLIRASIPSTIEIRQQINAVDAAVLADPVQVHQVIVNLCTNSAQAMEEKGGVLSVSLETVRLTKEEAAVLHGVPGEYVLLTVADTGCGMDRATRERIFDPYFTTKPFGKGTGMGLAVVHGIMQGCGGMARVHSEVGRGTTFFVYFPVTELPVECLEDQETDWPRGSERVLLVDDEPAIVSMGEQWLSRLGYQVTAVGSSVEALERFRRNPQAFDLVITDQTMPLLPGSELTREILKLRPEMPVILCTGYSSMVNEEVAEAIGIRKYMLKPLRGKELALAVRQVLDEEPGAG